MECRRYEVEWRRSKVKRRSEGRGQESSSKKNIRRKECVQSSSVDDTGDIEEEKIVILD